MTRRQIKAAKQLGDILASENEALRRLDYEAVMAIVPAKTAAVTALGEAMADELVTEDRALLAELGANLSEQAVENQRLLERAIHVQTKVVEIVVQAAQRPAASRMYNRQGKQEGGTRSIPILWSRVA